MVIIRVNDQIPDADIKTVTQEIHAQAETGVIVLPPWCEVLGQLTDDYPVEKIQLIQQKDDARVAELEQELAKAVADLAKAHTCETCKHEPIDPYACFDNEYLCQSCNDQRCVCRDCDEGSRWEWRHAHAETG